MYLLCKKDFWIFVENKTNYYNTNGFGYLVHKVMTSEAYLLNITSINSSII